MTAPKRYRKKPELPVEAVQWTGLEQERAPIAGLLGLHPNDLEVRQGTILAGNVALARGDYLLRCEDGSKRSLTAGYFQATYEEVTDGPQPNALSLDEATAVVAAAFSEDHDSATLDAAIKRLGDWVDASVGATSECPDCGGDGQACCGDVLDTGECCAALYGTDRLVPCPTCGGSGALSQHTTQEKGSNE
jgi:hypothetical protein